MTGRTTNKNHLKIIVYIIAQLLFALVVSASTIYFYNLKVTKDISNEDNITNLVSKVNKSVVYIQNYKDDALDSTGTGFIYKSDALYTYIITNEHVVYDSDNIKVMFYNDDLVDAKVMGTNKYVDIAVIRMKKSNIGKNIKFGNSLSTKVGEKIFLIGSPMGNQYKGTVTTGIISGKDVNSSVLLEDNKEWKMKSIQIDASVNPGNSGGPLFNMNGEVIGVITSKITNVEIEGISFATPIDKVKSIIKQLEKGKTNDEISLGIKIVEAEETNILDANNIKIPKTKQGLVLLENSTKYDNLLKGDTIVSINGEKIKDVQELKSELQYHVIDEVIEIKIERNKKLHTEKIKIK